jgi:hypothetical protein
MKHPHNVCLDHILESLKKSYRKTIRPRRLITVHTFHHLKNLTLQIDSNPKSFIRIYESQKQGHPT